MRCRSFLPFVFAAAAAGTGCRPDPVGVDEPVGRETSVAVGLVTRTREPFFQSISGTVRPRDHAVVAARAAGVVDGANFAVGQAVAAGEVLLTLRAQELTARSAQARAALDQAEREATREAQLFTQGSSTGEAARSAEDRLRAARAAFEEAQTLLGYSTVTAPFGGVVTRKLVNTGDYAAPGTPLFELEARERLRVELAVPENLPSVPLGQSVRVNRGAGAISAVVVEATPALDPLTRTRTVILEFASSAAVESGEFVQAAWPAGEFDVIRAPLNAVRSIGQIERVFVVTDGRAMLRIVKTGARSDTHVQIVSGLVGGERVVLSPPPGLRDGHAVDVTP